MQCITKFGTIEIHTCVGSKQLEGPIRQTVVICWDFQEHFSVRFRVSHTVPDSSEAFSPGFQFVQLTVQLDLLSSRFHMSSVNFGKNHVPEENRI